MRSKLSSANFAPAFNALLGPFDEAAKAAILKLLQPKMPVARGDQENWFEPYMGKLEPHLRDRYQKTAKNLKRGLVLGNPHSVIGLLCACFDFALNDKTMLDGVFKAIRDSFRLPGSRKLLDRLTAVNDFRNTLCRLAHHKKELNDKALAKRNLKHWAETLVLLKV